MLVLAAFILMVLMLSAVLRDDPTPAPAQASATPAVRQQAFVDVPSFAGKTTAEVEQVLGVPERTEPVRVSGKPYTKRYYRSGRVEIVFIDGRADWISVDSLPFMAYTPESLGQLGIHGAPPPTFHSQHEIRWLHSVSGFREVTIFPSAPAGIHYVYFKVKTK